METSLPCQIVYLFMEFCCESNTMAYLNQELCNFLIYGFGVLGCASWIATMVLFDVIGNALRCRPCKYPYHLRWRYKIGLVYLPTICSWFLDATLFCQLSVPPVISSHASLLFHLHVVSIYKYINWHLECIIWSIKLIRFWSLFITLLLMCFVMISGDCKHRKGS